MKIILLAFLFLTNAFAQIQFDQVTYQGTGCPKGTVSTTVSPDGSSLSVLFDEFRAEVPQFDGNNDNSADRMNQQSPGISHKACALSFTASLPPGTRADSLEISLQSRGATLLDPNISALFMSVLVGYNGLARSGGRPTIVAMKHWRATPQPVDDSWTEAPSSVVPLNSGCSGATGKSIRFDLKNHVKLDSVDPTRHGLITVDSEDMTGFLKFTLRTRPCAGGRLAPR